MLTLPKTSPGLQTPSELLKDFIHDPSTQAAFQRIADEIVDTAANDTSIRLPERSNERVKLDAWVEKYRDHFTREMVRLFERVLPSEAAVLRPRIIRGIVLENVWPLVAERLKAFFVRALAAAWAHEHVGDAVVVGSPRREGSLWVVPIGLPKYGSDLGRVTLGSDGVVVPGSSSTKRELLEIIRRAA